MICQICGINESTIHLTEIVNTQMIELHLCEQCAKSKSVDLSPPVSFNEILSGLVDFTGQHESKEEGITCAQCGMTYDNFKKVGRLGCAQCYKSFELILRPLIKRVQGAVHHMGKSPSHVSGSMKSELEIQELTEKLKKYVEREEFEDAAHIRDKIKALEAQRKHKGMKSRKKK